jgi:ABC-type transport system involved in multi-copper enzyme maturation permease subunit
MAFPIIERELRVAARRSVTYWSRSTVALFALFLTLVLLAETARSPMPSRALTVLVGLGVLLMVLALIAGCLLTADTISSEKRNGTLGLLLLTPLRGRDIVLGKLAASSLLAVFAFLGALPALSLPLLMGGVNWGETWRISLSVLVTLMFSLSLGTLISTLGVQAMRTVLATFILLLLISLLPILYIVTVEAMFRKPVSPLGIPLLSPAMLIPSSLNRFGSRLGYWPFWSSIGLLSAASFGAQLN